MNLYQLLTDEDAVSQTVGLVLFAFFVLIISATIGVIVLTASGSVGDSSPNAAFIFDFDSEADNAVDDYGVLYSSNDSSAVNRSHERVVNGIPHEKVGLLRVTYTDGPPLDADNLRIEGNRLTDRDGWVTDYSAYNRSDDVLNGESFELWMHVEDELKIMWKGTEDSAILQRYERPDR